jgi:hypothetical protein
MEPEVDEAGERAASADLRQRRIAKAMALANEQGGVIGRSQLLGLRVTRGQIRANIVARHWRPVRSQAVDPHRRAHDAGRAVGGSP